MPRTIQIRDLDDDVYAGLRRHAADAGISVPELLRREATKLASRPSMKAWLAGLPRTSSGITTEEVMVALDELRGPWPGAE